MATQFKGELEAQAWSHAMGGALVRGFGHEPSEIVANAEKMADLALEAFRARMPERAPQRPAPAVEDEKPDDEKKSKASK